MFRNIIAGFLIFLLLQSCSGAASYRIKGDRLGAAGKWDEAAAAYTRALLEEPDNGFVRLRLVRANQEAAFAHYSKGKALADEGKTAEGLLEFRQAVEKYPEYKAARKAILEMTRKPEELPVRKPSPVPQAGQGRQFGGMVTASSAGMREVSDSHSGGPEPVLVSAPADAAGARDSFTGISLYGDEAGTNDRNEQSGRGRNDRREQPPDPNQYAYASMYIKGKESRVFMAPAEQVASAGEEFDLEILVDNVLNLYGAPFYLGFNPAVIQIVDIREGDFLKRDGKGTSFMKTVDNGNGQAVVGLSRLGSVPGVNGGGKLAVVRARAVQKGRSELVLTNAAFKSPELVTIPVRPGRSSVIVR